MTTAVEYFNWPIDSDMPDDVGLDAFQEEYDINEFSWDLAIWWNTELARVAYNSRASDVVAADLLSPLYLRGLRSTDSAEVDQFIKDCASRIPRSEKRVVDHLERVVGHVMRSVDDLSGKPFRLYDPLTGIWREEGEWINERQVGTSVGSVIDRIIGEFEAAMHRAVDAIYDFVDDAEPNPGPKPQAQNLQAAWQARVDRRKRLLETVKDAHEMARSISRGKYRQIKSALQQRLAVKQTYWNGEKSTQWLVLKDGVLDLTDIETNKRASGVLAFSPYYASTMALDVAWADAEKIVGKSKWVAGVEKIVPDPEVREYLQKRYGAALLGRPGVAGKSMVWQYGVGDTGKSTLQEAIAGAKGVFAEYSYQADAEVLTSKGADRGATDRFIAYVRGKRYAIISELDSGAQLNQGKFKTMTGGETVSGTAKYSNEVTYFFTPTLFVSSNHAPNLPYGDTALIQRIHVVPFTSKLVVRSKVTKEEWEATPVDRRADENWLNDLLNSKEERAAILHWVIEGLIKFACDGRLSDLPKVMQDARKDFVSEGDPISEIVNSLLGTEPGWEDRKQLHIYTDQEWRIQEWRENEGVPVSRVEELIEARAIEMGIVTGFDTLSRRQLNAAKQMLDEMGAARKTVMFPTGKSGKAFARMREVYVAQNVGN